MGMANVLIWLVLSLLKTERVQLIFFVSCNFTVHTQCLDRHAEKTSYLAAIVLVTTLILIIALPVAHTFQGMPFASAADVFTNYTNYSDWNSAVALPMSFFSVA